MMNESQQRKNGAILSYISILVSTLVQLLYTPFLITKLGQSEYGLYSLIASIIGYLTVLDLGFGNAIVVYTAKYRAQKKYDEEKKLHGMFKIIFKIIGILASLLGILLFFNINSVFGSTMTIRELNSAKIMMLILSFNLFITFQFSIYSSIISAYEKFTFQKIMTIINTLLKPLIMIPLLLLGFKAIAMTVVITIINIIILLSNYLFCKMKLKINIRFLGFDKLLFKKILGYSIWVFLAVIVDKINWSVDQFVLGAVSGTIAVSIYSTASTLNTLFINLSTAISGVMLPKMSKMVAKNASNDELTKEFIKVGRIQYLITFLMATGLILFGKEFIIAWVGKKFETSYYVALILILPLCVPLIQNLGLSIMQAKNKFKFRTISMTIMSIFNVIISIFLAKKYGPIGSAVGTAISLIIVNIISINIYYYCIIKINIIQFWKEIIKMTFPLFIPIGIIIITMHFVTLHGYYCLFIFGGIYTILYVLVSYLLVMNNYEKTIINKVLIKLHLKKV
ncbi:MAG: oligosaccharide flippase family protein [Bacilli bacterium]|nr:oligosaccharide flippase family protein [Bacilli bacterium]